MENWNEKLHTAAKDGDIEALKLCLQNDADIDYQDVVLRATAFMLAVQFNHMELIRLLLDRGCQKETLNCSGFTALMIAVYNGNLELTQLLIDSGCQTAGRSHYGGRTALHIAAEQAHPQITRYLVEIAGDSPFVETNQGETPYDLAVNGFEFGKHDEVIDYLQTVMLEKSDGRVIAGLEIKASVRKTMLNKLYGSGSYKSFDMRCMVTGQFGVGKSSLVKLLAGDVIPEGRHPTDGISFVEGRCGLDIETRSWILNDQATYNAMDAVYNKVLMTSVSENKSEVTKTENKVISKVKPVGRQRKEDYRQDIRSQLSPAFKSLSLRDSGKTEETSTALNLSQLISIHEVGYIRHKRKKQITSKVNKTDIKRRLEKVLKSGKYRMKVGRLIFWDFGGQYVYYICVTVNR